MGKFFSKPKKNKYSREVGLSGGDMGVAESHLTGSSPSATEFHPHIHEDAVTAVAAVRPGVCLSGSKDKAVILYDFNSHQELQRWLGHEKEVTKVLYGSLSDRVFSASRDTSIQVWSLGSKESLRSFTGHSLVVTSIDLSPDEKQLISGSRDNSVRLWDVEACQQIRQNCISRNLVNTVKWVPGSDLVVQGGEDKEVRVFDTRTMEVAFCFPRKQYIQMCSDVSIDGQYCLTCSNGFGGSGCEATLWDLRTRSLVSEYRGHTEAVEGCAFLPHRDGKLLVTSSRDCSVRIWDRSTKECVGNLFVSGSGPLTSVAPCSDGSICVGSFNLGIQLLHLNEDDILCHRAQF
ncbi:WD repeat-containing protein 31-like isoform X2 [Liolophura sinensis]|uniref:WD repeat-containing protein 31-like isoform X2 n=1 Tax=Liolophura sinensis TaxID=3198878 RepID=UPI003158EB80